MPDLRRLTWERRRKSCGSTGPRARRSSLRRRLMAVNGEAELDSAVRPWAEEERRCAILMEKVAQASRCAPPEFRRRAWPQQRTAVRRARDAVGAERLGEDEVSVGGDEEPSRSYKGKQVMGRKRPGPHRFASWAATWRGNTRATEGCHTGGHRIRCGALIARGRRRI
jgi:hypothetical protein